MITKFETKSNRVKGLSFHPKRPWVLASLHNGAVQLWDYTMGTLLDTFEEHEGPVRGVDFHLSQPMFVSGGDDYKIKVWNYKLRRCLFTLLGHLDYIRTVEFHKSYPWIVSASDDQTLRIWNWMSRSCISVLTGHNHYVMCASFHPTDDLVVSASLDQTVRVWDTSGLRKKTVRSGMDASSGPKGATELFGGSDVVVKYVLEGHDRGVNWASFHPTLPLIVSGADDRQVKLWRMNDSKAWELDTLRGHQNNVSCAMFHPLHEMIVSNSEDRSLRVWDMGKRMGVLTFKREHDRFWVLSMHPTQDLIAAGHDTGMMVLKLGHQRTPHGVRGNWLYYVKDRYLRRYDLRTQRDMPVCTFRRIRQSVVGAGPRLLQVNLHNPAMDAVLVQSDDDSKTYELVEVPRSGDEALELETRRGSAPSLTFTSRNRLAVLNEERTSITIKDTKLANVRIITLPYPVDKLFPAPVGRLMLRTEERVCMLDLSQNRMSSEIFTPRVKRVSWSSDMQHVALLSNHTVTIADAHLSQMCTVTEAVQLKSGVWDDRGVFVYSTTHHIKYVLTSGDTGILRTLDKPLYVSRVMEDQVICMDRAGEVVVLSVDTTEYAFKHALNQGRFEEVTRIVRNAGMCGESVIAFLQQKGFSQVALHFVQDDKTKFDLALECGNLEVALEAAQRLDNEQTWHRLAVEALRQGNHQMVEMAYQRTKNLERLSFLYLITGNTDKLDKMLRIAVMRNDVMSRFHNALYLGDVEERVKVLEDVGQVSLAYLTAATHGLDELAARLREELVAAELPIPPVPENAKLLAPPTPLMREDNWPLLSVARSPFEVAMEHALRGTAAAPAPGTVSAAKAEAGALAALEEEEADLAGGAGGWGDDDLDLDGDGGGKSGGAAAAAGAGGAGGGGAWGDEDLDLDLGGADGEEGLEGATAGGAGAAEEGDVFVAPTAGPSPSHVWVEASSVAADHVAAGSFDTAVQLLHRQIGVVNFEPLWPHFQRVFTGAAAAVPGLPGAGTVPIPLLRASAELPADGEPLTKAHAGGAAGRGSLPRVSVHLPGLVQELKAAYRAFQAGQFAEAQALFTGIVQAIPMVVVAKRQEANELRELLGICREYLTALRLELARRASKDDAARTVALSAYLTHAKLQPMHLILGLNLAMTCAFKAKNFIHAASFSRRLLEVPEVASEKHAALRTKAKKVLQLAEKQARNAFTIDYDERNPFVVCPATLTPIYKGQPSVACPYCGASYKPEAKDKLCVICELSQIGLETLGLVCTTQKR